MRWRRNTVSLLVLVLAAPPSVAGSMTGASDPRIRTVFYDPDKVVSLDGFPGYELLVRFGDGEQIENVAIGDGSTWQVTPNKAADLLFIRPIDHAAKTNMTVVTNRHAYLFQLEPHRGAGGKALRMTFEVRFAYPAPAAIAMVIRPPPVQPLPPERRNTAYSYTGSRELLPSVVFDDGRATYFRWPAEATTPAVFAVAADGSESLVNSSWRQGYEAVEQLAPSFRLRDGKSVTTIINDGWRAPERGAEAPKPHDRKTAREAARQGAPSS